MNKILIFILGFVLITFVAFAHEPARSLPEHSNDAYSFEDGALTFKSDYAWVDFAIRKDAPVVRDFSTLTLRDITRFGFYFIGDDGQAGELVTIYQAHPDGTIATHRSVVFKGGDRIGIFMDLQKEDSTSGHWEWTGRGFTRYRFWVPEGDGIVTYTTTTGAIKGAVTAGNNVELDSLDSEKPYFCLFTEGGMVGPHFEYFFDGFLASERGQAYDDFLRKIKQENYDRYTVVINSSGEEVSMDQKRTRLPVVMTMVVFGSLVVGGCFSFRARPRKRAGQETC